MKKKELDNRLRELFPEDDSGKRGKDIDELGRIYNLLMSDTEPDPPGSLCSLWVNRELPRDH